MHFTHNVLRLLVERRRPHSAPTLLRWALRMPKGEQVNRTGISPQFDDSPQPRLARSVRISRGLREGRPVPRPDSSENRIANSERSPKGEIRGAVVRLASPEFGLRISLSLFENSGPRLCRPRPAAASIEFSASWRARGALRPVFDTAALLSQTGS